MEFSVVPITWLDGPDHCYWPEGIKNIRTAIVKGLSIQDNWHKYKCNIISKQVTYELALKAEKEAVATSESENDRELGKRKVKSKKCNAYVEYVGPPKLTSYKKSNNTAGIGENVATNSLADLLADPLADPLADSLADSLIDRNKNLEFINTEQGYENAVLTDHINNAQIIIEETNDVTNIINDMKKIVTSIQSEIESLKNKQEQSFSLIQETINLILAKINSEQYSREVTVMKDNKIGKYLPLTSIENLLEFEDILSTDQEALMQVVNKILLIGGKNEKDFIRRTLGTIFTDALASICSWTGQKNNFKVGDTHIMIGIKKAFRTAFPRITEKDFEYLIMEWFRFANVRKRRKQI